MLVGIRVRCLDYKFIIELINIIKFIKLYRVLNIRVQVDTIVLVGTISTCDIFIIVSRCLKYSPETNILS